MKLDRPQARWLAQTNMIPLVLLLALGWGRAALAGQSPASEQLDTDVAAASDVAVASTEAAPEASAPEPSLSAAEWYERGVELGNDSEYGRAAEAFLRSYELKPTSEALFNAAVAHENAGDPVAAVRAYRRFLAEPERSESLVPTAERSLAGLVPQVGTLKSVRHAEGRAPAQLRVNGEVVTSEDFPLVLAPGPIDVLVVDEAGTERSERYDLSAGDSLVLDLRALLPEPELEPEPERPIPEPPAPELEPLDEEQAARQAQLQQRALRLRHASFASAGIAGASGLAALTLGLLANDSRRRYEDQTCFEFPEGTCPEDFEIGDPEQQRRNYQRRVLAATVSVSVSAGFTLVAVVTGALSIHYARTSGASSRGPNERAARVELRPAGHGLQLRF